MLEMRLITRQSSGGDQEVNCQTAGVGVTQVVWRENVLTEDLCYILYSPTQKGEGIFGVEFSPVVYRYNDVTKIFLLVQ